MKKILLEKIKLENFKCYKNCTISFKNLCIIVGENNAGKSCLIEALRLVAKAGQGAGRRAYVSPPKEFELSSTTKGFIIDTKKLKIDLSIIIYFYDKAKYAKVTAFFCDKTRIEVYLNTNYSYAVIYDNKGCIIKSKSQAAGCAFDKIGILPQLGLIRENEKLISPETVSSDKDSYLSSFHFRNELLLWEKEYFEKFKLLSESTWKGLKIDELRYNVFESEYIQLFVQDNSFAAEIGKMGSGLQMWLQFMWFLARNSECELLILDEPDVYMHADLQRKVLELVKKLFSQIVIATHSLEIISRVNPDCILEINKKDKTMYYATDAASLQIIIDNIGGIQNIALLRLGKARKCLYVEGDDDKDYLNRFNEILFGEYLEIPIIKYGGFSNIPHIYGASNLFYNEMQGQIECYGLADRDFRDDSKIKDIIKGAQDNHLDLHIWEKKEIENYLINPKILHRLIPEKYNITYEKFEKELENMLENQKDSIIDSYASQHRTYNKELDVKSLNPYARNYVNPKWNCLENKLSLIGGKEFLALIKKYFKEKFNISISEHKILNELKNDEVPQEVEYFLKKLQV